jgi:hypothetical protein
MIDPNIKTPATTAMEPADVRSYYQNLNHQGEDGEYRANKYVRELGASPRDDLRPLTALPAGTDDANLELLTGHLKAEGAVVLKGAVSIAAVAAARAEHAKLLVDMHPLMAEMQAEPEGPGDSFYRGERRLDDPAECATPLRLRKTTRGRFELKSLDRRDCGNYIRDQYPSLPKLLDPLILPPVVGELLQRLMGTPWRVMRVGSIPAQPGADAGDFHRDIGEGLFGESFDLQLPDYYFNALIPLDPGEPAIGFSASVSVPSTQCVQHARSRC